MPLNMTGKMIVLDWWHSKDAIIFLATTWVSNVGAMKFINLFGRGREEKSGVWSREGITNVVRIDGALYLIQDGLVIYGRKEKRDVPVLYFVF